MAFLPNEARLKEEKVLQNRDFMERRSECEVVRWCGKEREGGDKAGGSLTTLGEGEGAVRDALLAVREAD